MTARSRYLGGAISPPPPTTPSPPPLQTLDSDFVVIIAALLCALICVLGLVAVARCAWIRRISGRTTESTAPGLPRSSVANKGLKKKVLKSLPKLTYDEEDKRSEKLSDCAICLTEFAAGDEIRLLPQCGHGFHVGCIDAWLGSHSSCPSCRQILVVARCQKCGGVPAATTTAASCDGARPDQANQPSTDNYGDRFLP